MARESIEHARRTMHDVVVVDTAGRLGIDAELMAQAAGIRDAVQPDETLFVVDAMIGQDAVTTAIAFQEGVGFSGVVLTKLDGDARGGAALSVRGVTGQPIMFASTGEKLTDFDVFHPERMASRILGMGDVLTLIEQAEQAFDADQAEAMAGKLASREGFTLEDFLEQMMAIRKMGPIANLLGMLPGAGQMKEQLKQHRRPRPGPHRGDHPVDDPGGAGHPQDHQRLAAGAHRQRLRRHRHRGQLAAGAVRAGPEDDGPDGRRMGMPGMGPMSKKARGRQQQAVARKGKRKGKKAPARRPIGAPGCRPAAPRRIPADAGLPPGQGLPDLTQAGLRQFKDAAGR